MVGIRERKAYAIVDDRGAWLPGYDRLQAEVLAWQLKQAAQGDWSVKSIEWSFTEGVQSSYPPSKGEYREHQVWCVMVQQEQVYFIARAQSQDQMTKYQEQFRAVGQTDTQILQVEWRFTD